MEKKNIALEFDAKIIAMDAVNHSIDHDAVMQEAVAAGCGFFVSVTKNSAGEMEVIIFPISPLSSYWV